MVRRTTPATPGPGAPLAQFLRQDRQRPAWVLLHRSLATAQQQADWLLAVSTRHEVSMFHRQRSEQRFGQGVAELASALLATSGEAA